MYPYFQRSAHIHQKGKGSIDAVAAGQLLQMHLVVVNKWYCYSGTMQPLKTRILIVSSDAAVAAAAVEASRRPNNIPTLDIRTQPMCFIISTASQLHSILDSVSQIKSFFTRSLWASFSGTGSISQG